MAILSAEKEWVEVNNRVCHMLGYTETELMCRQWAELICPEDRSADDAHFRQLLGGVVQGYVADQRFIRKDGETICASLSVRCLRKQDDAVDCILVLIHDWAKQPVGYLPTTNNPWESGGHSGGNDCKPSVGVPSR
jgi:PAS domain S-box-containing protein